MPGEHVGFSKLVFYFNSGVSLAQMRRVTARPGCVCVCVCVCVCARARTWVLHTVFPNYYSATSSLLCQTKSQQWDIMCKLLVCLLFSVLGKIRTAVGSAQLLMAQKFYQFRELCEENLVGIFPLNTSFPCSSPWEDHVVKTSPTKVEPSQGSLDSLNLKERIFWLIIYFLLFLKIFIF